VQCRPSAQRSQLVSLAQTAFDVRDVPGLEIAVGFRPYGRVGGDLFDVFPLKNESSVERWCTFIGDASGRGLAAALVMADVRRILRDYRQQISGPADVLQHLNRSLCRLHIKGFVTAFLGIFETSTRRFRYACAGHPRPLLKVDADGTVSRLDAVANYPIGIDAGEAFDEAKVYIFPGDTLLLYTDGVTEDRNPENEMFSEERLRLILAKSDRRPAELVQHIEKTLLAFRQGRQQQDDQAVVVIAGL
jgi:sigma-B regulation protein RsbU (phosphoserine phosphatase)